MNILVINALLKGGGTEVQTQREVSLLRSKGHMVSLLTFDPSIEQIQEDSYNNLPFLSNAISRVYYRNRVNKEDCKKIKSVINRINPNVIHINNLQDNAYTVLEACKGYPVLKTIRDPGLVCPKTTCLTPEQEICGGFTNHCCYKCIGFCLNYQIAALQSKRLRIQYLASVSKFICPSQYLSDVCSKNGIPTSCVNNPFDFSIVKKITTSNSKCFLYYGYVSKDKGAENLLKAFKQFHDEYSDASLIIAGKLGDISLSEIQEFNSFGVEYKGVLSQTEIMELYKDIYCVVVPSIWLENYPNTVLEALACRTLVIGSKRGGIGELIGNEALMFNPLDINDIENALKYAYKLSAEKYNSLIESNYNRIIINNKLEKYYNRLIECLESLI